MDAENSLWDESAEAWVEFVDGGDSNREYVLDPVMNAKCSDVDGLRVLDVGCGEGRFCRSLADRGAKIVGLDPTTALLNHARTRHPEGEYIEGVAESMPFEDASFDIVVSYVSLCDIPDYRKGISEMNRVLVSGGRMLVALHNAFATTSPTGWIKDENGNKTVFPVDHYTFEWGSKVAWRNIKIVNYHRPMGDYMSAFLNEGLRLESFEEPLPSPENIKLHKNVEDYLRVPIFVVMEWTKK